MAYLSEYALPDNVIEIHTRVVP